MRVTPGLLDLISAMVPTTTAATTTVTTAPAASRALRIPASLQGSSRVLHRYARVALAPLTHVGQLAFFGN